MDETPQPSLPEPDSVSSVSNSAAPERADEAIDLSHLPPEHRTVVRQLREKVQRAVATIERLRTENERLRQRVEALKDRPDVPANKTVLALDDDPQELRDRITTFIEAIDTYLEEESTGPPTEDFSTGTELS